jgi:tRNA 2-thiocytidine biosynthesis protein TtcA
MTTSDVSSEKALAKVFASAGKASAQYNMFTSGDRVLAAVSGGKDSLVMLESILHLARCAPFDFKVTAATFDPGFPGFNAQAVADYCRSRQVEHRIIDLDITDLLESAPPDERFRRPCVMCSRLRRGKLYGLAREIQANKLALGHHADDLLESFIISLVRGQGLTTMGPNVPADTQSGNTGALRSVRPLALVPEALVKAAAENFDFPTAGECIYKDELAATGDRAWAKELIKNLTERIPDLRSLMLKSMGRVELEWLLDKRYLNLNQ